VFSPGGNHSPSSVLFAKAPDDRANNSLLRFAILIFIRKARLTGMQTTVFSHEFNSRSISSVVMSLKFFIAFKRKQPGYAVHVNRIAGPIIRGSTYFVEAKLEAVITLFHTR
jgi:hypothetical protein